jgi:hypothetical protein
MSVGVNSFHNSCHVERAKIVHDPTIAYDDFLKVEIAVIGVKVENFILFGLFV